MYEYPGYAADMALHLASRDLYNLDPLFDVQGFADQSQIFGTIETTETPAQAPEGFVNVTAAPQGTSQESMQLQQREQATPDFEKLLAPALLALAVVLVMAMKG